jgi:hypothetical protein
MPIPAEMMPAREERLIDLVSSVGLDVSDWANYGDGTKGPSSFRVETNIHNSWS